MGNSNGKNTKQDLKNALKEVDQKIANTCDKLKSIRSKSRQLLAKGYAKIDEVKIDTLRKKISGW